MLSRLRYTLRETFDSFRRNATLTVASIITAAISLLGVGLTLLSQHAFDNLLARWEGGVEMIVFMNPTATADQLQLVERALTENAQFIASFEYCDETCSLEEADRIFAGEPGVRDLLTEGAAGGLRGFSSGADDDGALVGEVVEFVDEHLDGEVERPRRSGMEGLTFGDREFQMAADVDDDPGRSEQL